MDNQYVFLQAVKRGSELDDVTLNILKPFILLCAKLPYKERGGW